MKQEYEEVTAEQFGDEIIKWDAHNVEPLTVISLFTHFDDFLPTIMKYDPMSSVETVFIITGTFKTRAAALKKIGEFWDDAVFRAKIETG